MSAIGKIAGLVLLAMFVIFGIQYGIMAVGSTDAGVNMTGSSYENQYHASTNASISTFSLMGNLPILIGVITLVVAILSLAIIIKGKQRY